MLADWPDGAALAGWLPVLGIARAGSRATMAAFVHSPGANEDAALEAWLIQTVEEPLDPQQAFIDP